MVQSLWCVLVGNTLKTVLLMNSFRLSSLALALLFTTAACNKNDDECITGSAPASNGIASGGCVFVDPCAEPCAPDVVCTMDFRSISATLQSSSGSAASIDSFVVTDLAGTLLPSINGEPIYGFSGSQLTIASDAWVQGHQGMQMPVQAKGYANGTQVFDQAYTIGADCCHVYKAAGPDVIVVN